MITLERIVESIKLQLKPHLTEDVVLHDEWLIQMINDGRNALIKALYVSGDLLTPFYQEIEFALSSLDIKKNSIDVYQIFNLPSRLLESIGRKNIQYFGPTDLSRQEYHYCSYEELINYEFHRFGNTNVSYTNRGSDILVRRGEEDKLLLLRGIFEIPNDLYNYDYQSSSYPIGANNLRQLEIITFEHLLPKLGLPSDLINDGVDSTKGIGLGQQAQVNAQKEQIESQKEQIDKNIKMQAQQLFDQRQAINEQIEAQQKQSDLQQAQFEQQKIANDKQIELNLRQLFDQREAINEQIDAQKKQTELQKEQIELQKEQAKKQQHMQSQQNFDQSANIADQMDNQAEQIKQQSKRK